MNYRTQLWVEEHMDQEDLEDGIWECIAEFSDSPHGMELAKELASKPRKVRRLLRAYFEYTHSDVLGVFDGSRFDTPDGEIQS